ncbi:DUF4218 domain-containing protein [Abeliophyllum distichum]|uniref:DUF4218 domain-containing protein n=1 Tax=Abeliophyllum distichum TaxID=126358 RepID=A0ABD1T0H0_9LAMI
MIHLIMHLLVETISGSLVHMRLMYPFEQYLKKLKDYVRNRAQLEGSIAEEYVVDGALTFCSTYFEDIETRCDRRRRVTENNVTSIDISVEAYKDDQFILTSQTQQVFYIEDPSRGLN